jgi:hypothetical protein
VSDPVTQVEDAHGQRNLGIVAVRVYQGAREEAGSFPEAFWATVALLLSMMANPEKPEPNE